LLDVVEQLMIEKGYAAVTYRTLAARAGVAPTLVQYYFPTLDALLLAVIRRQIEGHVERLVDALAQRPTEPLHVIWEFSTEGSTAALLVEFTALGSHRESIRAEIAKVTQRLRRVQIDAVLNNPRRPRESAGELPELALAYLADGVPKLLGLEAKLGVSADHGRLRAAFESWIDAIEPPQSHS
jgi:TetR/AcrR family transcriptional regulator, transcriptional repressor for nem operon